VGGSGSTCFGSHDAQRDNDPSTAGSDDANGSNDRWQPTACVLSRFLSLSNSGSRAEEAFEAESGVDSGGEGRGRRHWDVTGHAITQRYHQTAVWSRLIDVFM
jgi:hypothetical protein